MGSQSLTFKGRLGPAASHTEGICLSPTVWGDSEEILEDGGYAHPELGDLDTRLRTFR